MKARIRAGELFQPVTIQKRITATNAEGNTTTTWTDDGTAMVGLQQQSVNELEQSGQLEQETRWIVTIRYPTVVNHESRLVFEGRVLDVRTVVNVNEQNRKVQLICVERRIGA